MAKKTVSKRAVKKTTTKKKAKRKMRASEVRSLAAKIGLEVSDDLIEVIQEQESPREYMQSLRREIPRHHLQAEIRRLGLAKSRQDINSLVDQARRVTGITAVEYIQRIAAARVKSGNTAVDVEQASQLDLATPIDAADLGYALPDKPAYLNETEDGETVLEVTVQIPIGDWQRDGYGVSLKRPPTTLRMDSRLNVHQRIAVGRIALGQYRVKGTLNNREITSKEHAVLRVLELIGEAIVDKDSETREYLESITKR